MGGLLPVRRVGRALGIVFAHPSRTIRVVIGAIAGLATSAVDEVRAHPVTAQTTTTRNSNGTYVIRYNTVLSN